MQDILRKLLMKDRVKIAEKLVTQLLITDRTYFNEKEKNRIKLGILRNSKLFLKYRVAIYLLEIKHRFS